MKNILLIMRKMFNHEAISFMYISRTGRLRYYQGGYDNIFLHDDLIYFLDPTRVPQMTRWDRQLFSDMKTRLFCLPWRNMQLDDQDLKVSGTSLAHSYLYCVHPIHNNVKSSIILPGTINYKVSEPAYLSKDTRYEIWSFLSLHDIFNVSLIDTQHLSEIRSNTCLQHFVNTTRGFEYYFFHAGRRAKERKSGTKRFDQDYEWWWFCSMQAYIQRFWEEWNYFKLSNGN